MWPFVISNALVAAFFAFLTFIGARWRNGGLIFINSLGLLTASGAIGVEFLQRQSPYTLIAFLGVICIALIVDILFALLQMRRPNLARLLVQQWKTRLENLPYKIILDESALRKEFDANMESSMTERLQALQMWRMGNEAFVQRKYAEAIKHYNLSTRWIPTGIAYLNKSAALIELREYDKAIEACREATRLNPKLVEAWINCGIAQDQKAEHARALESFDQALQIDADNPEILTYRGNAFRRVGRLQKALEDYDQAIASNPKYMLAWYNKGVALSKLGRVEEALECFSQAIKLDPRYSYGHYNHGNALNKLDRNEEAVLSYDRAIRLKSEFTEAWNNRGIALSKLGRVREAIKSYEKAIQIKPDYFEAWINRGLALEGMGKYEQAILSYKKFLELAPESMSRHLAIAQKRIEELSERMRQLEEIRRRRRWRLWSRRKVAGQAPESPSGTDTADPSLHGQADSAQLSA